MKNKKILYMLLVIIVIGLFNGCSDKNKSQKNKNKNEQSKERILDKPKYGGELSIFTTSNFEQLDPAEIVDNTTMQISANVMETLVGYDEVSKMPIPQLAESWEISESGLEWTFKIRENIKFHDGTELDASAVKYNFLRWTNNSTDNNRKFLYWKWMFDGAPGMLKSVEVVDKYHIKIRLKSKFAPFLKVLAMKNFSISSPAAIEKYGETYSKNICGTGPFILEKIEDNTRIVLKRNDLYWGGKSYLDKIIFKKADNIALLKTDVIANNINIIEGLPESIMKELANSAYSSLIVKGNTLDVSYIAMNSMKPPFDNENFRKAVKMAINKDEIKRTIYDNCGEVINDITPNTAFITTTKINYTNYDVEGAKKLLKKIGYKSDRELKIWVMNTSRSYLSEPKIAGDMIKNYLEAVGIPAVVEEIEFKDFIAKTQAGEHEIAIFGWRGNYPDPDNYIYPMFSAVNSQLGSSGNFSFYRSEKIEAGILKGRKTFEEEKRNEIYGQILKELNDKSAIIPLINVERTVVIKKGIHNYKPSIFGYETLNKVWKTE